MDFLKKGAAAVAGVAKDGADAAYTTAIDQAKKGIDGSCGEGTSNALQAVSDLLGKMYTDLYGPDSPLQYPMFLSLAMIFRQCFKEVRYKAPLLSGKTYANGDVFKKAARYGLYANAVYKAKQEDLVAKIPEFEASSIIHMEKSTGPKSPCFLIAEDVKTGVLVIAIRGTATVADALTDAMCEEVPFLKGHAHEAITENARNVAKIAKPILEELFKKDPKKKVVVTGHSLGAGTAVLLTLELFGKGSEGAIHDPSLVQCFAFAAPPVFHARKDLPDEPQIYAFINDMDLIPRFCQGTGVKLLLAVKEVDKLDMGMTSRLSFLASPGDEPRLPDFCEIPAELSSKFRSHHPAGTLILMYLAQDGSVKSEELQPDMTDRILLHKSFLGDHSMNKYNDMIQSMVLGHATGSVGDNDETEAVAAGRLPKQLERLPAEKLGEVVKALDVLDEAGLSEVKSVKGLRDVVKNSKALKGD